MSVQAKIRKCLCVVESVLFEKTGVGLLFLLL